MKRLFAVLTAAALLLALWGCGAKEEPVAAPAPSEVSSEDSAASEAAEKAASEAAASEAAEKAASEAAASEAAEKAASEAAASEAAEKAASEAAASEAAEKAASDAAVAAAAEAAAKAASDAAVAEAAAKAASETSAMPTAQNSSTPEAAPKQPAASEKAEPEPAAQKATANKKVTGTNFESGVESKLLKLHNEERAAQGLGKLSINEDLQSAARTRSRELCKTDTFAHQRPNGDDWSTVIKVDIPIKFKTAGENLSMVEYNDPNIDYAYDADYYFEKWVDSPSHYANIIRPEFDHVGFGVYCIEKGDMVYGYATAIFAKL